MFEGILRSFTLTFLAGALAVACSNASLNTPAPIPFDASAGVDAGSDAPTGAVSQCPEPQLLSPEDLPSGFLAPQKVSLKYVVDGDTAHFVFPDGKDTTVRFLYVNTEESHGDETTDFGIETAKKVDAMLKAGKEFAVAVQEGTPKGTPLLDTFGRTLGLVFVDGTLFQTTLVRDGYTAYYTQFGCAASPIHEALLYAEAEANANKRGIWQAGHPTSYETVLARWMGKSTCRPNPYKGAYCTP
jgi:endonuclease YncB( thermonuclease family)